MWYGGGWSVPFSGGPMHGFNGGAGWGLGILGWLLTVLWWVLMVVAVVALVRWLRGSSKGGDMSGGSGLAILKQRYAKGEIDKKEFEEKKRDLQ